MSGVLESEVTSEGGIVEVNVEEIRRKSLPSLMEFAAMHPLFPSRMLLLYKIFRDLHLGAEYHTLEVLDGSESIDFHGYYLRGKVATTNSYRLLIPVHYDTNIDLSW
jgi:hypothetical protein